MGNTRLFVEYGLGVGTFTKPVLERLGPDSKLLTIDTNPDFTHYLKQQIDDPRLVAVTGSAADVETILADRQSGRRGLRPFGTSLFDASSRRRRFDCQGNGDGRS